MIEMVFEVHYVYSLRFIRESEWHLIPASTLDFSHLKFMLKYQNVYYNALRKGTPDFGHPLLLSLNCQTPYITAYFDGLGTSLNG